MSAPSARPKKTKHRMILAAMDLFHAQGVRATSPQDVMDRTATGKSQFYHHFGSKEGLVHETLQYFYAQMCEGQFNNQPIRTWKGLEAWFGFFVTVSKQYDCQRGCPIGTIGNELDPAQELIRQDVNAVFTKAMANLERFFDNQKEQKRLKVGADPQELAQFCFATLQGGLLVSKVQRHPQALEAAVKNALIYLKSLRQSGGAA
ncbi:MAG: TetR/AcrR family transcriptional regulator [Gammaproteobacteria bacterium]|nr:TetR/AcrR family transcriptional regulator [Gammaproteobacteria bacterium]